MRRGRCLNMLSLPACMIFHGRCITYAAGLVAIPSSLRDQLRLYTAYLLTQHLPCDADARARIQHAMPKGSRLTTRSTAGAPVELNTGSRWFASIPTSTRVTSPLAPERHHVQSDALDMKSPWLPWGLNLLLRGRNPTPAYHTGVGMASDLVSSAANRRMVVSPSSELAMFCQLSWYHLERHRCQKNR